MISDGFFANILDWRCPTMLVDDVTWCWNDVRLVLIQSVRIIVRPENSVEKGPSTIARQARLSISLPFSAPNCPSPSP